MTTTPLRNFLLLVFCSCVFLSLFTIAAAQSCTATNAATVCTGGKICDIPRGSAQGQCRTPGSATDTSGGTVNTSGGANTSEGVGLVNPLKVKTLEGLLGLIIDAAVQLGTIVLILALVYVGFLFVASRGNEEKIRSARTYFFWIVIGGLLVLGAKGLSEVIKSTASTLGT